MKVTEFDVKGPKLIELKVHGDARGFFVERFVRDRMLEIGLPAMDFVQDNYSRSAHGVLRGLHYQHDKPQGKLVTATRGRIYDVAVDIRRSSPTFGRSVAVELDGDTPMWFWIPEGFAHGFAVLSEEGADLMYKVNAPYNPHGEGGIMWNDLDLAVPWPLKSPSLSARDEKLQTWSAYRAEPKF